MFQIPWLLFSTLREYFNNKTTHFSSQPWKSRFKLSSSSFTKPFTSQINYKSSLFGKRWSQYCWMDRPRPDNSNLHVLLRSSSQTTWSPFQRHVALLTDTCPLDNAHLRLTIRLLRPLPPQYVRQHICKCTNSFFAYDRSNHAQTTAMAVELNNMQTALWT